MYGTTELGGANNGGTLFRITPAGELTTVVTFGGSPAAANQPFAPLYFSPDGNIYGTSNGGGPTGQGTVFKLTPSGSLTILHSFAADGSEGGGLFGGVITTSDGTVYGTTSDGGAHPNSGNGTVFKITSDGTFSTLNYFPYTAANEIYGLTAAPSGTFYGVTEQADAGEGEAFSVTADGLFAVLHTFGSNVGAPEGAAPAGPLTLASDGNFYGVTSGGGTSNSGTIYKMTQNGVVTPLYSFSGAAPVGGLIEGLDGRFYGMTANPNTQAAAIYSVAMPPAESPSNVSAAASDGTVDLSWTAAKSASTYSVYEGIAAGAEGTTAVLSGITTTTAKVTGLQDGTTYYFQVVALNEAGSGPVSAEVAATPIAAPTNLSAAAGNASISLSWTAAAGATSYSVFEGNSAGGEATGPIATGITATSYSVTGLANGTPYYFKVASVNGTTVVGSSVEASATPSGPAASSTGSSNGGGGSGGGGGGGSIDGVLLLALGLLILMRMRSTRLPPPRTVRK